PTISRSPVGDCCAAPTRNPTAIAPSSLSYRANVEMVTRCGGPACVRTATISEIFASLLSSALLEYSIEGGTIGVFPGPEAKSVVDNAAHDRARYMLVLSCG